MKRVLLLLASTIALFAQFDTRAVVGNFYDGSREPVVAAVVTIEDVRKGIKLNSKSSEAGTFEFLSIPIGRYKATVTQAGFRSQSSAEFEVTIGAKQRVDFKLDLDTVQTSVQVVAEVALLQTDTSGRGQTIAAAQIREVAFHPLAFAETFRFLTGEKPKYLKPIADASAKLSGVVTSFAGMAPTNRPLPGVKMSVFALRPGSAERSGEAI